MWRPRRPRSLLGAKRRLTYGADAGTGNYAVTVSVFRPHVQEEANERCRFRLSPSTIKPTVEQL